MQKLLNESSVDYTDPEKGDAVRSMFAGIAGRYDRLNRLLSFNQDQRWRRKTVKLSRVQTGDRVLDVCCGTGDLAFAFEKAVGNEGQVIGSDFTPEMIEIANSKRDKLSSANQFQVADTLALPFPEAAFDVCSVGFGIRNVQDVGAGIREMARTIKPGGRLVILEFTDPKNKIFAAVCKFYMNRILPKIGQLLSGSKHKAYSYLPDSIALFPDADALAALMRASGLKDVTYKRLNLGTVAIHVGVKA